MPKRITGKTHVGERRERRPNGDLYIYERITAYNEKTQKTYTVSQKLKGKIKAGTQEMAPTRPKKRKGEGGFISAVRRHTGLTDILAWIGKASGIDDDVLSSFSEGDGTKILSIARYWVGSGGNPMGRPEVFVLIHFEQLLTSALNVKKNQHSNRKCVALGGQFSVITTPLSWSILG
jgi:hypothetical protein